METFKSKLRNTRLKNGLTFKDLSETTGRSKSYLCQVEMGDRLPPSAPALYEIVSSLDPKDGIEWYTLAAKSRGWVKVPVGNLNDREIKQLVTFERRAWGLGK